MDQTIAEYCQLLVNTRTQLELEILRLKKELADVRSEQAKEKEVQETQDGILNGS
jgi:hypothetical protein